MKNEKTKPFIKLNLNKVRAAKDDKEVNSLERMAFVKFWANYVKTHKDKDWSEQQNIIINSQYSQ